MIGRKQDGDIAAEGRSVGFTAHCVEKNKI
jgi:hypothetical protein